MGYPILLIYAGTSEPSQLLEAQSLHVITMTLCPHRTRKGKEGHSNSRTCLSSPQNPRFMLEGRKNPILEPQAKGKDRGTADTVTIDCHCFLLGSVRRVSMKLCCGVLTTRTEMTLLRNRVNIIIFQVKPYHSRGGLSP